MRIEQIGFMSGSQQVEFSSSQKNKENNALNEPYDTVTFSDEAIALAKQMYFKKLQQPTALAESSNDDMAAERSVKDDYRKIFDGYRKYGLFSENASSDSAAPVAGAEASAGGSSFESMGEQAARLEKQLRDLMQQLEDVMSSDLPEMEKETKANEIQKKISELQSQLSALKRAAQQA